MYRKNSVPASVASLSVRAFARYLATDSLVDISGSGNGAGVKKFLYCRKMDYAICSVDSVACSSLDYERNLKQHLDKYRRDHM